MKKGFKLTCSIIVLSGQGIYNADKTKTDHRWQGACNSEGKKITGWLTWFPGRRKGCKC